MWHATEVRGLVPRYLSMERKSSFRQQTFMLDFIEPTLKSWSESRPGSIYRKYAYVIKTGLINISASSDSCSNSKQKRVISTLSSQNSLNSMSIVISFFAAISRPKTLYQIFVSHSITCTGQISFPFIFHAISHKAKNQKLIIVKIPGFSANCKQEASYISYNKDLLITHTKYRAFRFHLIDRGSTSSGAARKAIY